MRSQHFKDVAKAVFRDKLRELKTHILGAGIKALVNTPFVPPAPCTGVRGLCPVPNSSFLSCTDTWEAADGSPAHRIVATFMSS